MEWTSSAHDDYSVREILNVKPIKYKPVTAKHGNAWFQIADILNSVTELSSCANQRSVRDRWTYLDKAFRKNMSEQEKASGNAPPDLTDIEIGVQEII